MERGVPHTPDFLNALLILAAFLKESRKLLCMNPTPLQSPKPQIQIKL